MRRTAFLCFATLLLLSACTSTQFVQDDTPPSSIADVNRTLRGEKARIELSDGEVIGQALDVVVGEATTTYRSWHTRAERSIPTESIVRISIPELRMRDFSPIMGLLGGAMAGPVVVLLASGAPLHCEGYGCLGTAIVAGLSAVGGGIVGLITGFAVRGPATMTIIYESPVNGNTERR